MLSIWVKMSKVRGPTTLWLSALAVWPVNVRSNWVTDSPTYATRSVTLIPTVSAYGFFFVFRFSFFDCFWVTPWVGDALGDVTWSVTWCHNTKKNDFFFWVTPWCVTTRKKRKKFWVTPWVGDSLGDVTWSVSWGQLVCHNTKKKKTIFFGWRPGCHFGCHLRYFIFIWLS